VLGLDADQGKGHERVCVEFMLHGAEGCVGVLKVELVLTLQLLSEVCPVLAR
jgi:hypothetical protein